jgi:glucokinase
MSSANALTSVSDAEAPLYAGVDVGGTNIKLGVVDNRGRTLARSKLRTESQSGPEDAVRRMAAALRSLVDQLPVTPTELRGVGLATPGTMDIPAGLILEPPNLPTWRHYPIRDRLSEECGKPVAFANDANAAAYGEFWVGSGKEFPSIVMLTLGTGVGGGIIVDGHLIDGQHSHGSECGHIIIDYHDEARMCPCGQRGHLEAYASATALVRRTEEVLATARPTSIRTCLDRGESLTPLLLAREAAKDDALALELILDTAKYLGVGIVSLIHTIDPGAVVLGGAMNFGAHGSALGRRFLERVRQEVHRRAFPVLVDKVTVDFASLGEDAGYIGAAGIARLTFQRKA